MQEGQIFQGMTESLDSNIGKFVDKEIKREIS